jgi:hypothetical protein
VLEHRDAKETRYEQLSPTTLLRADRELCLVRDASDRLWYMGSRDADGAVVCWGSYGADLDEAIRAL